MQKLLYKIKKLFKAKLQQVKRYIKSIGIEYFLSIILETLKQINIRIEIKNNFYIFRTLRTKETIHKQELLNFFNKIILENKLKINLIEVFTTFNYLVRVQNV